LASKNIRNPDFCISLSIFLRMILTHDANIQC